MEKDDLHNLGFRQEEPPPGQQESEQKPSMRRETEGFTAGSGISTRKKVKPRSTND